MQGVFGIVSYKLLRSHEPFVIKVEFFVPFKAKIQQFLQIFDMSFSLRSK